MKNSVLKECANNDETVKVAEISKTPIIIVYQHKQTLENVATSSQSAAKYRPTIYGTLSSVQKLADISITILGADFLRRYRLLAEIQHRSLADPTTSLRPSGKISTY